MNSIFLKLLIFFFILPSAQSSNYPYDDPCFSKCIVYRLDGDPVAIPICFDDCIEKAKKLKQKK